MELLCSISCLALYSILTDLCDFYSAVDDADDEEADGPSGVGDEFTMFTENPELKQMRMRLDHIVGAFEEADAGADGGEDEWTKAIRSPVGVKTAKTVAGG